MAIYIDLLPEVSKKLDKLKQYNQDRIWKIIEKTNKKIDTIFNSNKNDNVSHKELQILLTYISIIWDTNLDLHKLSKYRYESAMMTKSQFVAVCKARNLSLKKILSYASVRLYVQKHKLYLVKNPIYLKNWEKIKDYELNK
jgi:hypothetical protein